MTWIEIREEDEVFEYHPDHPQTGEPTDTVLQLRIVPKEWATNLRKTLTRIKFRQGQRTEDVDWTAWADACLDRAIVGWTGVKKPGGADVPCEATYKALLPERLKAKIIEICVGREIPMGDEETGEPEGEAPAPATPARSIPAPPSTTTSFGVP